MDSNEVRNVLNTIFYCVEFFELLVHDIVFAFIVFAGFYEILFSNHFIFYMLSFQNILNLKSDISV